MERRSKGRCGLHDFFPLSTIRNSEEREMFFGGRYSANAGQSDAVFGTEGSAWPLDQRSWYLMGSDSRSEQAAGRGDLTTATTSIEREKIALPKNYSKDWVNCGAV